MNCFIPEGRYCTEDNLQGKACDFLVGFEYFDSEYAHCSIIDKRVKYVRTKIGNYKKIKSCYKVTK